MNEKPANLIAFGKSTLEMIELGPGYRRWPLTAFRGPVFRASRVGGPRDRGYLLLPLDLLNLLYGRFAQLNADGVLTTSFDEAYDLLVPPGFDEEEAERRYESGEILCDLFEFRRPGGRDPLLRYLPELFEPEVLNRILRDSTLDSSFRRKHRPPGDKAFWSEDKHYRWSDWWRLG